MDNPGASLSKTNEELVKIIKGIKEDKDDIQVVITQEEEEKHEIEQKIGVLNERLEEIKASLQKKYITRSDYDKTIQETEGAFVKILESQQTLLHVMRKEDTGLKRKKAQLGLSQKE